LPINPANGYGSFSAVFAGTFVVLEIVKGWRLKLCRAEYECFIKQHTLVFFVRFNHNNVIADEVIAK